MTSSGAVRCRTWHAGQHHTIQHCGCDRPEGVAGGGGRGRGSEPGAGGAHRRHRRFARGHRQCAAGAWAAESKRARLRFFLGSSRQCHAAPNSFKPMPHPEMHRLQIGYSAPPYWGQWRIDLHQQRGGIRNGRSGAGSGADRRDGRAGGRGALDGGRVCPVSPSRYRRTPIWPASGGNWPLSRRRSTPCSAGSTGPGADPGPADQVAWQLAAHDALGAHAQDELGVHRHRPRSGGARLRRRLRGLGRRRCCWPRSGPWRPEQRHHRGTWCSSPSRAPRRAPAARGREGALRVTFWGAVAMGGDGAAGRLFGRWCRRRDDGTTGRRDDGKTAGRQDGTPPNRPIA